MTNRPYFGKPVSDWRRVTQRLVKNHPLELEELRDAALTAWQTLWKTKIGSKATSLRLTEITLPATITGYFFEVLLGAELSRRFPEAWKRGESKREKDLVYVPRPEYSVEVKTSGQFGFKVFGNRSYGQKQANQSDAKKEKSGYYLTVNFFGQVLTLMRFGWIDADDWDPQQAPTGQMAGLRPTIYEHKLIPIPGEYRRLAPIGLLHGVGLSAVQQFNNLGIQTVGDLLSFSGDLPKKLALLRESNKDFLEDCYHKSLKR